VASRFQAAGISAIIAIYGFDTSIIAGLFSSLCLLHKKGELGYNKVVSTDFSGLRFGVMDSGFVYKSQALDGLNSAYERLDRGRIALHHRPPRVAQCYT
jgi:hypothetical protein